MEGTTLAAAASSAMLIFSLIPTAALQMLDGFRSTIGQRDTDVTTKVLTFVVSF